MRILTANLLATIALALCASAALGQGMTGAGGTGGAGGGADSRREVVVREADRSSPCAPRGLSTREPVTRERLSQAPPLDPTRKVNEAVCTKPFDFLGKGNLCCI